MGKDSEIKINLKNTILIHFKLEQNMNNVSINRIETVKKSPFFKTFQH